jgi:hypothetical protein
MTTKKKTALAELAENQEAIRKAEAGLHEAANEQRASSRRIDRARGPLTAYYEAVGSGRQEPDPDEEARLIEALRQAEGAVSVTVSMEGIKLVDLKAQSILVGAREAVQAAQADYEHFVRTRYRDIAAEIAVEAKAAADRFDEVWAQVEQAEKEWTRVSRLWQPLIRAELFDRSDFPHRPLAGVADEVYGGVPLPMPRQLAPDD